MQFPPPDESSRWVAPTPQPEPYNYYASEVTSRPWSPRRKAVLIVGIVAAGAGLLTGVGVGAVALVTAVSDVAGGLGPVIDNLQPDPVIQPPLEGDPSSPTALQPESCPDVCFGGASVGATILPVSAFTSLGLTDETAAWGDTPESGIGAEFGYAAGSWVDREGTPDECFITYQSGPLAYGLEERPPVSGDSIYWTGSRQDTSGYNAVGTSVRITSDSDAAVTHMTQLDSMLSTCSHYEIGHGADYWSADVSRAPQLEVPRNVAAVGWVEDSPFGRFYTVDVQRSNLIVRVSAYSDGTIGEVNFRMLVEQLALQLSSIDVP